MSSAETSEAHGDSACRCVLREGKESSSALWCCERSSGPFMFPCLALSLTAAIASQKTGLAPVPRLLSLTVRGRCGGSKVTARHPLALHVLVPLISLKPSHRRPLRCWVRVLQAIQHSRLCSRLNTPALEGTAGISTSRDLAGTQRVSVRGPDSRPSSRDGKSKRIASRRGHHSAT